MRAAGAGAAIDPAGGPDAGDPAETFEGLYFYGVLRPRAVRRRRPPRGAADLARIRYRDLEALVRRVPYELPPFDEAHVHEHQRTLEAAMHLGTVLPAPFGIVFRGRRPLIRMMQDEYLALEDGLAFLEGHWELRLHISPSPAAAAVDGLSDVAMDIYAELRRFARAAVPFRREANRLVSAAFLVDRAAWIEFVERAEEIGVNHAELDFDITGPWPAYDFVRVVD